MQTEEGRIFKMNNSDLAMFVTTLVVFMRRDKIEFSEMGITEAMTDEFEALDGSGWIIENQMISFWKAIIPYYSLNMLSII